jgi:hypothetical protein
VDQLVQDIARDIKGEKSWVKFGVSPFGIWRSGQPSGVRGLSAVDELFADSRRWLQAGWVDYLSPQLYWQIDSPQQSFADLLDWWSKQNRLGRHLWPGLSLKDPRKATIRDPSEIMNQISLTRAESGVSGHVLWSARALVDNQGGMAGSLARGRYLQPALVPVSEWLAAARPSRPLGEAESLASGSVRFRWTSPEAQAGDVRFWVLQTRQAGRWSARVVDRSATQWTWSQTPYPDVLAVTAVDGAGQTSLSRVWQRSSTP